MNPLIQGTNATQWTPTHHNFQDLLTLQIYHINMLTQTPWMFNWKLKEHVQYPPQSLKHDKIDK